MVLRLIIAVATLVAAGSALADPMSPDMARHFVVGKLFSYNCFDGTRGRGRIYGDGSVVGTMQSRADGPVRYVHLPAGTLRVKGNAVCASLRGMPFEPCFNLERTSSHSFRGSISGLSFAYCDFDRRRTRAMHALFRSHSKRPVTVGSSAKSGE
jgi:hypothetical protein